MTFDTKIFYIIIKYIIILTLILDLPEVGSESKKSKRGRRKGAKNRLKLDPDTGQLVRTLIKRPRKQSPTKKSRPIQSNTVTEESILLTDHASLWSAAMASWPPGAAAPSFPGI